jgi:hypothetical protein
MQNEMKNKLTASIENAKKLYEGDVTDLTETEYVAECLLSEGIVIPPCKVGEEIWVVEEDDTTCYMFLAKSKGCIIATSWINDYDLDETIEYHIEETQNNLDTGLAVFPEDICFATREEAEEKLKGGLTDA